MIKKVKLLLLFSFIGLACKDSLEVFHSSCVFYINFTDTSCTQFSFTECQWKECEGSSCDRTKTSSNWKICTRQCCDQSIEYPQHVDSIHQCSKYRASQSNGLLLVWSIVASAAMVLCAVLCCCCAHGCNARQCLRSFRDVYPFYYCFGGTLRPRPVRLSENGIISPKQDIDQDPQKFLNPVWIAKTDHQNNLDETCIICLQDQPSLQLQCKHAYHRSCIIGWLNHKKCCVLCRSTHLDIVHIYCEQCFTSYFEANLLTQPRQILNHRPLCNGCAEQ